jgi:hypothetical protein
MLIFAVMLGLPMRLQMDDSQAISDATQWLSEDGRPCDERDVEAVLVRDHQAGRYVVVTASHLMAYEQGEDLDHEIAEELEDLIGVAIRQLSDHLGGILPVAEIINAVLSDQIPDADGGPDGRGH